MMAFVIPENMDELSYFTRRNIDEGKVIAWVERGQCPKCKKGLMAKPKDPKTGKYKIRSKIFVCGNCGYEVDKKEFEDTLFAKVIYTCPHCKKSGEKESPFKRKKIKGIETLRVICDFCGGNIDITKKMKVPKSKK